MHSTDNVLPETQNEGKQSLFHKSPSFVNPPRAHLPSPLVFVPLDKQVHVR